MSQQTSYVVRYEMRKGSQVSPGSKTVVCTEERSAIESARGQAEALKPGYVFVLKSVIRK